MYILVVIKYNDLICLRGLRLYFSFQSQVTVQHWVKSVWKLQTATNITYTIKNRENLVHPCLLACFLVLNSIFPLTQYRTVCQGNGVIHSELCIPTSINLIQLMSGNDVGQALKKVGVVMLKMIPRTSVKVYPMFSHIRDTSTVYMRFL